jgi:hypothetical protein
MHAYFISYNHSEGFGNIEFYTRAEITRFGHIREIENMLNEGDDVNHPEICILNYQLLHLEEDHGLSEQFFEEK